MYKRLLTIISAILLLASCKKERINEHPQFIGEWDCITANAEYYIAIEENGQAFYSKDTDNTTQSNIGKFALKRDKIVKIGFRKFKMDEYPNLKSSNGPWTMVLDDKRYYKRQ